MVPVYTCETRIENEMKSKLNATEYANFLNALNKIFEENEHLINVNSAYDTVIQKIRSEVEDLKKSNGALKKLSVVTIVVATCCATYTFGAPLAVAAAKAKGVFAVVGPIKNALFFAGTAFTYVVKKIT